VCNFVIYSYMNFYYLQMQMAVHLVASVLFVCLSVCLSFCLSCLCSNF